MAAAYSLDDIRAVYGEPWLQIPCSERLHDGWMDGGLADDVRQKCLAIGDRRVYGIRFFGVAKDNDSLFLMVKDGRPFLNIYGETVTSHWLWLYDADADSLERVGDGSSVSKYGRVRTHIEMPDGFYAPRRCCYIKKFLLPTRDVHFYEYVTHGGFTLSINGVSLKKENPQRTPALAELLDMVLAPTKPPTEEDAK